MKFLTKDLAWLILTASLMLALVKLGMSHRTLGLMHKKQSVEFQAAKDEIADYERRFTATHPNAVFKIYETGDSRVKEIPHSVFVLSGQQYYSLDTTSRRADGSKRLFSILIRYFPSAPTYPGEPGGNVYEVIWNEGKNRVHSFAKMAHFPDSSRIVKTGAGRIEVGRTEHFIIELIDDAKAAHSATAKSPQPEADS